MTEKEQKAVRQSLQWNLARSRRVAAKAKRYDVRLRAEGRVTAYETALRLIGANR